MLNNWVSLAHGKPHTWCGPAGLLRPLMKLSWCGGPRRCRCPHRACVPPPQAQCPRRRVQQTGSGLQLRCGLCLKLRLHWTRPACCRRRRRRIPCRACPLPAPSALTAASGHPLPPACEPAHGKRMCQYDGACAVANNQQPNMHTRQTWQTSGGTWLPFKTVGRQYTSAGRHLTWTAKIQIGIKKLVKITRAAPAPASAAAVRLVSDVRHALPGTWLQAFQYCNVWDIIHMAARVAGNTP
jgi:hypothetical protein